MEACCRKLFFYLAKSFFFLRMMNLITLSNKRATRAQKKMTDRHLKNDHELVGVLVSIHSVFLAAVKLSSEHIAFLHFSLFSFPFWDRRAATPELVFFGGGVLSANTIGTPSSANFIFSLHIFPYIIRTHALKVLHISLSKATGAQMVIAQL